MGKWHGKGQPPTRRKLHRLREQQRKERIEAYRAEQAFDRARDRELKRMNVDYMLTERGERGEFDIRDQYGEKLAA